MKKINLEKILMDKLTIMVIEHEGKYWPLREMHRQPEFRVMIDAMQEACNKTVDLCAENARPITEQIRIKGEFFANNTTVDKDSILKTKDEIG